MATDTTTNQTEAANTTSTIHESDVEQVHLTQSGTPVQVQVPQGENVVRIQVTPGETIQLPFPADGLVARLGDNGNLAVKVGDVTVILLGYADAVGQGDVNLVGNDGQPVDVAAVLAATDPNLDIQTAAGPGAGDQGAGVDNNGGVFSPFDPNAGIGGLDAIGGLDPTALNYNLIQREFIEIIEADEVDTAPVIISITPGRPVNEDDLEGGQGNDGPAAKEFDDFPSHVLSGLNAEPGIGGANWGFPYEIGNDPFDTKDHEDGSQQPGLSDDVGGVDQDREPLTTTAVVSVNFFGDVPGHLSFINGGNTPIIDQLQAMNLTSHSHPLQYVILPGSPDTNPDPDIDNSYGETLVAYYVTGGGEGDGYATVVFTISMREFDSSSAPADINIDFTIYGVIDNVPGTPDAAGDISDILDIAVPFFAVDSDGTVTPAPDGALVFQDIDDTPSLGSLCYQWVELGEEEGGAWLPVHIKPTDSDIVHDETKGVQDDGQEAGDPDSDQEAQTEDDVNPNSYTWLRDEALTGAGLPTNSPLLGMALSQLTVSFGADGRALGNNEAGKTVFTGDAATNSQAFQIYIGSADAPLENGLTNWTITENGVVIDVLAEQTDANTIVGYALVGEGDAQTRIEVFVLHVQPNNGEVVLLQLHQVNQPDPANSDDSTPPLKIFGVDSDGNLVAAAGDKHDTFDSLSGWTVLSGGSATIVGDIGTTDSQPNPSNQALLLANNGVDGEGGENGSWLADIQNFFDDLAPGAIAAAANDGVGSTENPTDGTAIKQTFNVSAGDVMQVKFNFLESEGDGDGYQDSAFIVVGNQVFRLSNVTDANVASTASSGSFSWSEESGYLVFTFHFTTTGPVDVGFIVMNDDDTSVDPGLLIDELVITNGEDVNFRGTDYDGDHVDAPLSVIVQDDGPQICKIEYTSDGTNKHGKGYVDEDWLSADTNGVPGHQDKDTNPDNLNSPIGDGNNGDGPGKTHVTGQIIADFGVDDSNGSFGFNVLGLTVGGAGADSGLKTAGGDPVFYKLVAVVGGVELQAYDPSNGDSGVFKVFLNTTTGAFSFDLQAALFHKDNDGTATKDADTTDDGTNRYEDDLLIQIGVDVKDSDGDVAPAILQFKVDDDGPKLICEPRTTSIENGECPVCQTEVSTAVAEQDEGCLSEETCMVTIAPGQPTPAWLKLQISVLDEEGNNNNNNGVQDALFQQNGLGYGVISGEDGGSGGRFDEINYDHTANEGEGGSETLIFKIGSEACPQLALSATVELSRFFSNEGNVGNEQGHWEAWKDGVKVAEGDFTATNLNGQFGLAIPTVSGGFDELRFTAKAGTALPGGGFSDDSDYYVQNLSLEIKPTHLINGEFKYSFGADDGSVAPDGVAIEYTGGALTQGGHPVVLNEVYDDVTGKTTISGYVDNDGNGFDAGDLPVFSLVLDPSVSDSNGVHTANYTFTQYGPLDNDGGMSNLPFQVVIQDRDHDAITTTIDVCIDDSAPETSNACATVFEKGLDQSGSAKDGTDENADSEFAHGFLSFSYNGDGPGSITSFALTSGPVPGVVATLAAGIWTIDVPQFKITVDAITGEYNFTLKQNFNHDDTKDDGFDNDNGVEPTVNVGDILKELGFTYTVEDGDGTEASGGLTVKVVDDGPILCIDTDDDGATQIDESPSNQRDDRNNNEAPASLVNVVGAGAIIEFAKDGDAVIDIDVEFGADGAGPNGGIVVALSASAPGVDSGLNFKDSGGTSRDIVLTTEGGVVVGRVSGGPDDGKPVFAVTIDQDGELSVAQYLPIQHANPNDHDDSDDINNSALVVTVTATDGDGDSVSKSANIGEMVRFYDDGPSIDNSSSVTLDEDVIPGAGGNHPGGSGDVNPSLFTANGDLNISFGTDGPGAIEITLNGSAPRLTGDGPFLTFVQVGDTLIGHTGVVGDPALTVKVNNDGTYTVTLFKPLDHPNGNNENDIDLQFKVKVTDNDGDSDTGTINVKIDDDAPTQVGVIHYTDQNTKEPTNGDNHHGGEYGYLDEDFLPTGNKDLDPNDTDDAIGGVKSVALLSGVSVGADGGSLTLGSVGVHGDDGSGLRRSSDGALITMVTSPDGQTITGYASNTQDDAHKVFTIKIVGNTVEFELFQALLQDDTDSNLNSGDGNIEGEIKFDIQVNLTDKDNDTTSTIVRFLVDDDKPTADVLKSNDDNIILTTQDAETIGGAFDTAMSAANFGGAFSFSKNGGADGELSSTLTYALNVTNSSSGLQIGGVNINLYKVGSDIIGSTAGSVGTIGVGNTVFKITVDGNGVVTLTQYQQIDHGNPESVPTYDDDLRTLANGKVSLTATGTITDKDKDSASDSETIDLGGNIKFADDGPNAVNEVSALVIGSIGVTANGTNLMANDTVGADTPGAVTQVNLGGVWTNIAAGAAGSDFFVDGAGNKLASAVGSVGILNIQQDGDWSFKQTGFTGSDLNFSYKLVDKDGDSDTASFTIDTQNVPPPSFTWSSANVDEDGLPNGNFDDTTAPNSDTQPGDDITGAGPNDSSEKTYEGTFGLGAQSITSMSLAATTLADLANFKNLSGVSVNNITLSNGNLTLVASAGGIDLVKVEITNATTGAFKVTLLNPIKHTDPNSEDNVSANVQVTATNAGGSQTNGIVINVDDDRPTVSLSTQGAPTLTVDETAPGYGTPTIQSVLGLFGAHTFGADGAAVGGGVSYSLTGAGGLAVVDGTPTGLTNLTGHPIQLFNFGGAIQGKVVGGPDNGIVVFGVSISGSNVTLEQIWPIKHPNIANPDDALSATANLIYVTKTVTDADGDVAKATSSSALTLTFKDDGPDAVDDSNSVATLGVAINGNVANNDNEGTDFIVGGGHPNGKVESFTIDAITYAADGSVHNIPGHGTMSMTSTGAYVFTQTEGPAGVLNVSYKLVDGDGDSDTATLAITTVADAAPINYNDKDSGNENVQQDTNIMIILDNSGSMGWDIDAGTPGVQDRLTLAKAALTQLLNAYDNLGEIRVTVVSFESGAVMEYAWGGKDGALVAINALQPANSTNYQAAVETADDAWTAPGRLPDAKNVVYFLSDGEPTTGGDSGNHLTQAQKDVWDAFLENPANEIDNVYAVAIGAGISGDESNPDSDLKDVADPDGNDSPDGQVIYVTDESELAVELVGTITNQPIEGNVLNGSHTSGNGDTGVAGVTPDAAGNGTTYIHTFVYNSANNAFDAEFSWNGVAANLTLVGEGANADSVITGHSVTFKTEYGEMTFNFDTGAYSFAAGSVPADTNVVFHYGTKDADGDTDLADAAGGAADDDAVPGNSIPGGADLVITIHNVNQAPNAVDDVANGNEGNVIIIPIATLLGNDSDPDGTIPTFLSVQGGVNGSAIVNGANIEFTPTNPNYFGPASFTYTITDGALNSTATVNITIANVNDAPVAVNDNAGEVGQNSFIDIPFGTLTGNDTDIDGGALTVNSVSGGVNGSVSIQPGNIVRFTPNVGYTGPASFQYTVNDGNGGVSNMATVALTVVVINAAPIGVLDHIYTNSTDDVTVQSSWLLRNDSDPDGGPASLSISDVDENTDMISSLNEAGLPGSFIFNLSGSNTSDGSIADFDYDVTDGKDTTNVGSKIHLDESGAIDGGATNDIVIGSGGNETLVGNGGIDILIGNGGNDTLVFDASDVIIDGGSGFDRVQTAEASFTFDNNPTGGAKFAGVEMVDLGDSGDHDRTVVINAADVLGTTNVTVDTDQISSGTFNTDIDLFVIGDGSNTGADDNVNLKGFTQVTDVNPNDAGNQGTFDYKDAVTNVTHTYTLWQNGDGTVKVAVENGLDVTIVP